MEPNNQVVVRENKKKEGLKKVLHFVPALLVLLVVGAGAFAGASLVQKPTFTNGFAGCCNDNCQCACWGGGTNKSWYCSACKGQSYDSSTDSCQPSGGGGGSSGGGGGSSSSGGYNQAQCEAACKSIKGSVNGGSVGGRKNTSKNEGGVKSCECYCKTGDWNSSFSACDGGKASKECTNGTTAARDGCTYQCENGAWVEKNCGPGTGSGGSSGGTGGTGGTSGGSCGTNGDVACDGESRISNLSACGDGKGRVCQINGTWSGCVNADKCGFQGTKQIGEACNFSSACSSLCCVKTDSNGNPINQLASGQAGVCGSKSSYSVCTYGGTTSGGQCSFNGKSYSIPSSGSGNFVGCGDEVSGGDGDRCNNCYVQASSTNGGSCSIKCFRETLSCGLRCRDNSSTSSPPTTPPSGGGGGGGGGTETITEASFYCSELAISKPSPKVGDTLTFTCNAAGSGLSQVTSYNFQYRVNDGQFREIGISSTQNNVSIGFTVEEPGQYEVQCRACSSTKCTEWDTL